MRELRWFGPPATCTAATVALRRPPTNSPCELARAHNAEAVSVGPGIRRARASFRGCEDRARLRLRASRRANARTCDWGRRFDQSRARGCTRRRSGWRALDESASATNRRRHLRWRRRMSRAKRCHRSVRGLIHSRSGLAGGPGHTRGESSREPPNDLPRARICSQESTRLSRRSAVQMPRRFQPDRRGSERQRGNNVDPRREIPVGDGANQ